MQAHMASALLITMHARTTQVPAYMVVQLVAATIASLILRLMFDRQHEVAAVTVPVGSNIQSLVLEFIITFYLMFVIMAVATDDRAVTELQEGDRNSWTEAKCTNTVGVRAGRADGRARGGRNHHAQRTVCRVINEAVRLFTS
jgi:glycerol uptake facilitator-like aquaporin